MRGLKRIAIMGLLALGLAAALPAAVAAQSLRDTILGELRQQGYSEITVSRTLLGRTRIVAESDEFYREIVLNPSSGTILRDYWRRKAAGKKTPEIFDANGRDRGGNSASAPSSAATSGSGSDDGHDETESESDHEDSSSSEDQSDDH